MTIFFYRVNSVWKAELDTLQLEQKVQFVDFTEFLRQIARAENRRGGDDEALIRSWLKPDVGLESRCVMLGEKIRSASNRYSTVQNGTAVVKLHDGFEYDSYDVDRINYFNTNPAKLLPYGLELGFRKTRRIVFVDSVISSACLRICSLKDRFWRSIRLIRTTVYAVYICQHLLEPLYIARHDADIDRNQNGAVWAQLLDTYGQLSDMKVLSSLKQSVIKRRETNLRRFEEDLSQSYTG